MANVMPTLKLQSEGTEGPLHDPSAPSTFLGFFQLRRASARAQSKCTNTCHFFVVKPTFAALRHTAHSRVALFVPWVLDKALQGLSLAWQGALRGTAQGLGMGLSCLGFASRA